MGLRREKIVEYLNIGVNVGRFIIEKENDEIEAIDEN
jgi:hypothetical protein